MRTSLLAVTISTVAFASLIACSACSKPKEPAAIDPHTSSATAPAAAAVASPTDKAEVGKPAPDFTLKDLDGKDVRLSSFKGKTVVLEWFNPGCPFVKASHTKGSLKDAAKRHTK